MFRFCRCVVNNVLEIMKGEGHKPAGCLAPCFRAMRPQCIVLVTITAGDIMNPTATSLARQLNRNRDERLTYRSVS